MINAVTKQGSNRVPRQRLRVLLRMPRSRRRAISSRRTTWPSPRPSSGSLAAPSAGRSCRTRPTSSSASSACSSTTTAPSAIPARPDLNQPATTETRVWNTLIRFDHQINANHTWAVRWLRESSPQYNQLIGAVTLAAAREESDLDQTIVGTLNSVLGTKVNILRVGFTQEDGRSRSRLPRCAAVAGWPWEATTPTAHGQPGGAPSVAGVPDLYRSAERHGAGTGEQLVPVRGHLLLVRAGLEDGDHEFKGGLQAYYVTADSVTDDNLNGTFTIPATGRTTRPTPDLARAAVDPRPERPEPR